MKWYRLWLPVFLLTILICSVFVGLLGALIFVKGFTRDFWVNGPSMLDTFGYEYNPEEREEK